MINVKDKVYSELSNVFDNVSDAYPNNWSNMPAIQYMEEDNHVHTWTSEQEELSYVRYRIDIWDTVSTSEASLKVDEQLSALGLKRTSCQDVDDPSHLKHKVMRYEAILEPRADGTIFAYNE